MSKIMNVLQNISSLSNLKNRSTGSSVTKLSVIPPQLLVDAANELSRELLSYLTIKEQEETKRTDITARRDVAIEAIISQRLIIQESLRYMFEERAQVIQKQFQVLDHALEIGNVEMVDAAMKGMVNVIQSSPFKNIQELQQAMGAKDFVVRLE